MGPPHSEAWFAARAGKVTASMSSHLMVDTPWRMAEEQLAAAIKGSKGLPPKAMMDAGTHFEVANMGWLSFLTGATCEPDGYVYTDTERPYIGASPDGWFIPGTAPDLGYEPPLVVHDAWGVQHDGDAAVALLNGLEGRIALEMKQSVSRGRSKWTKDVSPDYYTNQAQHQMLVLGVDTVVLMAKVDAYELWGHVIERSEGYTQLLDEACRTFWEKHLR